MPRDEATQHIDALRRRLSEAEDALAAIREGHVDAVIVQGASGPQVFSLSGAETVYRRLIETMGEAALQVTTEGTILFCNECFCELVATPMPEVLGKDLLQFIAPEARGSVRQLLEQCTTQRVSARVSCRGRDDRRAPTLLTGQALRHERSVTLCLVATDLSAVEAAAQEIADLKHAQAELSARETLLQQALEVASAGSWKLTPATGALEATREAKRIHGLALDADIECERVLGCVHPDDRTRFESAVRRALDSGEPLQSEHRVGRADGSFRWVATRAERRGEGEQTSLIGLVQDVSERKAGEELAARDLSAMTRLQRLATLFVRNGDIEPVLAEIVDVAIAIAGADFGTIQLVGPASGKLRIAAQQGFPAWWVEYWDAAASEHSSCDAAVAQGERVVVDDIEHCASLAGTPALDVQRRAGVRAVQSTALMSRSGKRVGVFSTHYRAPTRPDERALRLLDLLARQAADIIERTQTDAALLAADRQKDEFLAMLAHELRNPLAPIRNAGALLSRMLADDARAQEPLAMIRRQSGQLIRLVDDLLDISRIAQGRIDLKPEVLEIGTILDQASETVQPLIAEKGHELRVHRPPTRLHVRGDRARLVQALANLLHNAAKYTDPGGSIALHVHDRGEHVDIDVLDNGMGISGALLPKVFDLFVQNERTLDRSQGGLGVGLSVVKRLVEMHGGGVVATSAGAGQGSMFSVRLARVDAPPVATAAPARELPARRRILVVDDNVDAADSLAMLLQLDGHDVETVYGAAAALAAIEAQPPEVVLLDVGMPHLNGYEVAQRVRAGGFAKATQLVAVTGYGQLTDQTHALAAGFDAHLVKPVDMDALARLLARPGADPAA